MKWLAHSGDLERSIRSIMNTWARWPERALRAVGCHCGGLPLTVVGSHFSLVAVKRCSWPRCHFLPLLSSEWVAAMPGPLLPIDCIVANDVRGYPLVKAESAAVHPASLRPTRPTGGSAAVEDLHRLGRDLRLHLLAEQTERHRVEVLLDLDVVVQIALRHYSTCYARGTLSGYARQRFHAAYTYGVVGSPRSDGRSICS